MEMNILIPGIISLLESEDRGDVLLGQEYFNQLNKEDKDNIMTILYSNDKKRKAGLWGAKHAYIPNPPGYYAFRTGMLSTEEQSNKYTYITLEF